MFIERERSSDEYLSLSFYVHRFTTSSPNQWQSHIADHRYCQDCTATKSNLFLFVWPCLYVRWLVFTVTWPACSLSMATINFKRVWFGSVNECPFAQCSIKTHLYPLSEVSIALPNLSTAREFQYAHRKEYPNFGDPQSSSSSVSNQGPVPRYLSLRRPRALRGEWSERKWKNEEIVTASVVQPWDN